MSGLIAWEAGLTMSKRLNSAVAPFLIVVALCTGCALIGYCLGVHVERTGNREEQARAESAALLRDAKANERAADDRVADAISIAVQGKELTDAVAKAPSGAPDAARVAYGCERLRQAGRTPDSLPAICRR